MGNDSDIQASSSRTVHSGRKGSKKVRTGCITCKIRKVKCDEAKPFCTRCTKTGRHCDGYLDAKSRRTRIRNPLINGTRTLGEPQTRMTLHEWATPEERRAFHFFQHVTAPCLAGDLDGKFWRVLVLQICEREPAVRHAILAVSSFHESMLQMSSSSVSAAVTPYGGEGDERHAYALYQYNRAIACLLDQMRADSRPLVHLLTCVLFVCIEVMQGKDRESIIHLEQGRQILDQIGRKAALHNPEIDLIKQQLVPMYTRLSLTALLFGGNPVAIPSSLRMLQDIPMIFETIDEVRCSLYDLMDECIRFAKKSQVAKIEGISPDSMRVLESEQDYLLRKMSKFNVAFSLYQSTKCKDAAPAAVALIQIHVHMTFIWVSTALSHEEMAFDNHVATFSAMIPLATTFVDSITSASTTREHVAAGKAAMPPNAATTHRLSAVFTFEMHVIAPLYFVVAKCRHPLIRRAALELMRRCPARRENLWRANVMSAIAERTMLLEEKHLRSPQGAEALSRSSSPPEVPVTFPYFGASEGWTVGIPELPFADNLFRQDLNIPSSAPPPAQFATFDGSHLNSSCSSVSTGAGSIDPSMAQDMSSLASHLPIDPSLLFDADVASSTHSFSAAPSVASSLDEMSAPMMYVGGGGGGAGVVATTMPGDMSHSVSSAAAVSMWGGNTSYHGQHSQIPQHSQLAQLSQQPQQHQQPQPQAQRQQHAPNIALEPPTPMDDAAFMLTVTSRPHLPSHPQSRSHSRQTSRSLSVRSDASPPSRPAMSMVAAAFQNIGLATPSHSPLGGNSRGSMGGALTGMNFGQSMLRSVDAPFDVPERFRVHEAVIGPESDAGSWVMMFRKLSGLDAEWDVRREYIAVAC